MKEKAYALECERAENVGNSGRASGRKSLILLLLALVLSFGFSLAACGSESKSEEEIGDTASAILGMAPVFQSLAIYSEINESAFVPSDNASFWRLMWIMSNIIGADDEDIVFDLSGIAVPKDKLISFARAASSDFNGSLPELPESTTIVYDAENDCYIIPWSKTWARSIYIDKVDKKGETYIIDTSLLDLSASLEVDAADPDTPVLFSLGFEMAEDKEGREDSPYRFRISKVVV